MRFVISVIAPSQTEQIITLNAPNPRDAELLAARDVTETMSPPPGTRTRILEPTALIGYTSTFPRRDKDTAFEEPTKRGRVGGEERRAHHTAPRRSAKL